MRSGVTRYNKLVMAMWVILVLGFALFFTDAYAEDCKYEQIIKLDDNGEVLSSKTEYICKGSKPILVLEPTVTDQVKYKRPPVVSTYDYMQSVNSNENRLDRILSLLYSGS